MARPSPPTLAALAVAGALALAACLVALMSSQEAAEAAFPRENGRIAFTASPFGAGPWEIYTMLPDGFDRRQITFGTANAWEPDWSPDGTKIAFWSPHQESTAIFTMNPDGSGLKQITPTDEISGYDPAWSPDGTKIAFASWSGIHVMNADGSDVKRLTNGVLDMNPVWSPDGTKVAFERQRERAAGVYNNIWVMNASDGTGQVNLTSNAPGIFAFAPAWSPDGTKIAFSNDTVLGDTEIYTMNASGSSRTALTNTPTVAEYVSAWSPDGTQILFEAYDIEQTSLTGIWKMRIDGTNRINILADSHAHYADWQPLPKTSVPESKADCKRGGWREFGFKNQGQCVAFVNRAASNR